MSSSVRLTMTSPLFNSTQQAAAPRNAPTRHEYYSILCLSSFRGFCDARSKDVIHQTCGSILAPASVRITFFQLSVTSAGLLSSSFYSQQFPFVKHFGLQKMSRHPQSGQLFQLSSVTQLCFLLLCQTGPGCSSQRKASYMVFSAMDQRGV